MSLENDLTPQQTKAERRLEKRLQAERIQAETAAREKRTKNLLWSVIALSVAGLIGLAVWQFMRQRELTAESVSFTGIPVAEVTTVPAHSTPDGGIVIDRSLAASDVIDPALPTVTIYLDYHCSWCAVFEQVNFQSLVDMAESGEANVVMHPIAILDGHSQTTFSTRAAAAAVWVAARAPQSFIDFHDLMFQNQPQGGSALSNAEIADLARRAGASDDVANGIADGTAANTYGQWATSQTVEVATQPDFRGTPMVLIDGQVWDGDFTQPGELRAAVQGTH